MAGVQLFWLQKNTQQTTHTHSQSHCSHDIWNENVNNDLCTYKIIYHQTQTKTQQICGDDNRAKIPMKLKCDNTQRSI